MSARVKSQQVTEYIIDGYIRSVRRAVIKEISSLCISYIGDHFTPYKGHFEWIFQCSNFFDVNTSEQDSDDEREQEFKSPEYPVFGGKLQLKLSTHSNKIYAQSSLIGLPSEWSLCFIQQKIKCVETELQVTILHKLDEPEITDESFKITDNAQKYQQLTFIVDIINIRYIHTDFVQKTMK